ncbi:cytochrome b [Comamonas faecalis]|uniref:Cytochrome b n=1 Tax=Comamonas faecalis TaxID=1387849 RepID=A0ABP7RPI4_9BURK
MPSHYPRPTVQTAPASAWRDTPQRFGRTSRWLHWGMALLFLWQFAGMAAKVTLGRDDAFAKFMVGTHAHLGLLLLLLVLVRGAWGLMNWQSRPGHAGGWLGMAARWGHGSLYALMVLVPSLALLRMLGNDRPFTWLGLIELNDGSGPKVDWMIAPAKAFHGVLGWTLLALIVGHIVMVVVHRRVWNDGVAERMIGRVA